MSAPVFLLRGPRRGSEATRQRGKDAEGGRQGNKATRQRGKKPRSHEAKQTPSYSPVGLQPATARPGAASFSITSGARRRSPCPHLFTNDKPRSHGATERRRHEAKRRNGKKAARQRGNKATDHEGNRRGGMHTNRAGWDGRLRPYFTDETARRLPLAERRGRAGPTTCPPLPPFAHKPRPAAATDRTAEHAERAETQRALLRKEKR